MLVIRRTQMRIMQHDLNAQYAVHHLARLRAQFPGQTQDVSDLQLRDRLSRLATTAQFYGISNHGDLFAFISLALLYGDDFHEFPPIQALLRDTSLDAFDRIGRVITGCRGEWKEGLPQVVGAAQQADQAPPMPDLPALRHTI